MNKKGDGERGSERLEAILWAVVLSVFGFSALHERIYQSFIHGIVDLGKYHRMIGLGSLGLGLFYFYLAIRQRKEL